MAHTGKNIVRLKGETYNLTWMDKDELDLLLLTLKLDVADINNQIEIDAEGGNRKGSLWRKSAISAAKIKLNDIKKVNRILEDYSMPNAVTGSTVNLTGVDLEKVLAEIMKDNIPDEIIKMVIDRTYKEIYK